jgi:hypothetical protein
MRLHFIDDEFCFSAFDAEKLIDFRMNFVANFLAWLQAHYNQLAVGSGE